MTGCLALRARRGEQEISDDHQFSANYLQKKAYDDEPPQVPQYPSKLARKGGIRNLVPCYGIQDRRDGQGGLGLASKWDDYVKAMGG